MKCPKCGYVSFDHNDTCPKCNKSISTARDTLHLPSYKPAPPSLLGSLTGKSMEKGEADLMSATGEPQVLDQEFDFGDEDMEFDTEEIETEEQVESSFDDTYRLEAQPEIGVEEESQEVQDLSEDIQELDLTKTEDGEGEAINLDDISIGETETEFSTDETSPAQDLPIAEEQGSDAESVLESPDIEFEDTITLEDLTEAEPQDIPVEEEREVSVDEDQVLPLDTDEYTQDETEIQLEEQEIDTLIDTDELTPLDLEEQSQGEQEIESPIEMDETVSLEIDGQSPDESEDLFEAEKEEPLDPDKTLAMNLEDLMQGDAGSSLHEQEKEEEAKPDASLPIIEEEIGDDEAPELLTLDDLGKDESEVSPVSIEDTPAEASFDQDIDIGFEEDDLSTEDISLSNENADDEEDFTLDLDALELELELEPDK